MKRRRQDNDGSGVLQCSNRTVIPEDVEQIRQLIVRYPDWGRQQLSVHLCQLWDWRRPDGTLSHRACRHLLVRLAEQGQIPLPPSKRAPARIFHPQPEQNFIIRFAPEKCTNSLKLDDLIVRPVRLDERPQWKELMEEFHYLGFHSTVGESIWYVAIIGAQWVALLAWAAAAFKSRHREAWVGWDPSLKRRRLHLLANNVRFLILPDFSIKNLASKVLSLNLRRLSDDWQARYGHPILLAETFVDFSRFAGTCYRAAGWIPLGQTRGFKRRRNGYTAHGQPKMIFVRPLYPDATQRLMAPFPPPVRMNRKEKIPMIDVNRLPMEGKGGLMDLLRTITDPRKPRGVRHPVVCIVAMATCACLSGARSFEAIAQWAATLPLNTLRRLGCKRNEPPSEPTFRRTLQRLDAKSLDCQISQWLVTQNILSGKAIAVDGKTVRGARDGEKRAPHLLSAVLHHEGIVVAQLQVGDKTNEIPTIQPLLNGLNLKGAVVTADSLHTQKETARYLVEEKKADYVFTVKDNQPTLRKDIQQLGLSSFPPSTD
jgi:hypothetical protein